MRFTAVVIACTAVLLTGCGSGARRIDAANRAALQQGDQIVTMYAAWDSEPREWLLISDYRAAGDDLYSGSRWLLFNDGSLDEVSRDTVQADEELVASRTTGKLTEHQERYREAARGRRRWTWEIFSTNTNPRGLDWQSLGTRTIAGEELSLYRARVTEGCPSQSDCVFASATSIVGLTADRTLRLEFLENTGEVTMARWLLYWHESADRPLAAERSLRLAATQRQALYTRQRDRMRQVLEQVRLLSP